MLGRVHRFADPAEATASLQLRRGNPAALGFYDSRSRLSDGSRQGMLEEVYDAWRGDQAAGCSTLMVSASSVEVAALCARARAERVTTGDVEPDGVRLHDGNLAGTGDVVVTRANRRTLAVLGGRDFVKNGDLWRVTARHSNNELTLTHLAHGGRVRLPAEYAAAHLELGYATTVHRAQGMTVDTAHVLVDKSMCRESLYVAMSRGRTGNHAYVVTDEMLDVDLHHQPAPRLDAIGVLTEVLAREGSERSATETIQDALEAAESLATLVPRYLDALTRATVTPEVEAAVRAGLRDAGGPALEQQASQAPGWHRLLVASAGPHARETVAEAVRCQLLDAAGVHDVVGLLAARVARLGAEHGGGAGLNPAPSGRGGRRGCPRRPLSGWPIRSRRGRSARTSLSASGCKPWSARSRLTGPRGLAALSAGPTLGLNGRRGNVMWPWSLPTETSTAYPITSRSRSSRQARATTLLAVRQLVAAAATGQPTAVPRSDADRGTAAGVRGPTRTGLRRAAASGGYAGAPAPPTRPASATRPDATRAPPVTPRPAHGQPRYPLQRGRRLFAVLRGETVLGTGRQGTRT